VLAVAGATVAVSAAVSAIITVIVGTAVNWGGRVATAIRTRVVPDHQALYRADWPLSGAESADDRLRVKVSCAPERSRRRSEIDPDEAIRFVRAEFGHWVLPEPVFSSPATGVRFEAPGGRDEGYVWVWAGGRVDLAWHLPGSALVEGKVIVPLLEVLRPVVALATAVRGRSYRAVFPDGWRGRIRRFDWFTSVSTAIVDAGGVTRSWDDIAFPGRRPRRAGAQPTAILPVGGYAAAGLRRWKPSRPIAELVAVFLDAFLKTNGYHDCDHAIADAVAAIEADSESTLTAARASGQGGSVPT
jgi:hypothetical protein